MMIDHCCLIKQTLWCLIWSSVLDPENSQFTGGCQEIVCIFLAYIDLNLILISSPNSCKQSYASNTIMLVMKQFGYCVRVCVCARARACIGCDGVRAVVHEWEEPCFHSFVCVLLTVLLMSAAFCPFTLLLSPLHPPRSAHRDESPSSSTPSGSSGFLLRYLYQPSDESDTDLRCLDVSLPFTVLLMSLHLM